MIILKIILLIIIALIVIALLLLIVFFIIANMLFKAYDIELMENEYHGITSKK